MKNMKNSEFCTSFFVLSMYCLQRRLKDLEILYHACLDLLFRTARFFSSNIKMMSLGH
jgi:hypothetical protein